MPMSAPFSGMLTMGSSFLTVNSAWERYIESTGDGRGCEEELVELATTREWEKDPWLAQLD